MIYAIYVKETYQQPYSIHSCYFNKSRAEISKKALQLEGKYVKILVDKVDVVDFEDVMKTWEEIIRSEMDV